MKNVSVFFVTCGNPILIAFIHACVYSSITPIFLNSYKTYELCTPDRARSAVKTAKIAFSADAEIGVGSGDNVLILTDFAKVALERANARRPTDHMCS